MKKILVGTAFVFVLALVAILLVNTVNPSQTTHAMPQPNCKADCSADLKACLGQAPATDKEKENERRQACYKRYSECSDKCK